MNAARAILDAAMTEREWQTLIVQYARLCGWDLVFHPFDSRRSAYGFPDLTLLHQERRTLAFFECKTERGKVRPMQQVWIDSLANIEGVVAKIVRPSDWQDIVAMLEGRS